jgi:alpha/beta superfamily hydrolase
MTAAISATVIALASALAAPARASTSLPVNYDFIAGATLTAFAPNTPPPGANNASCQLTAAHPYPVVLVFGTFANMDDNWQAASPLLADNGYCVYAFNYGGASASSPIQGTGEIATSAAQLATGSRNHRLAARPDRAASPQLAWAGTRR